MINLKSALSSLLSRLNLNPDRAKSVQADQENWAQVLAKVSIADMLSDFRAAADRHKGQAKPFEEFAKGFRDIATRYGWAPKEDESKAYRAIATASTNLRQTYGAAQQEQRNTPEVKAARPGLMWVHGNPREPRLHHKALSGKVFDGNAPFWSGFSLPSGYGCTCQLKSVPAPPGGYFELSDRLPYTHPSGSVVEVPAVSLGGNLYPVVEKGFLNPFGGLSESRQLIFEQMISRQPPTLQGLIRRSLPRQLLSKFLP